MSVVCPFDPGCYNQVHFGIRKQLPAFAKWLHAYYSSHQAPLPVHVDYLRGLSNSADSARRSFRQTLVKALHAIHEASAKLGHSFQFGIDTNDIVHVQQDPTPKAGVHFLAGTFHS